jgi:hypothetical protein
MPLLGRRPPGPLGNSCQKKGQRTTILFSTLRALRFLAAGPPATWWLLARRRQWLAQFALAQLEVVGLASCACCAGACLGFPFGRELQEEAPASWQNLAWGANGCRCSCWGPSPIHIAHALPKLGELGLGVASWLPNGKLVLNTCCPNGARTHAYFGRP